MVYTFKISSNSSSKHFISILPLKVALSNRAFDYFILGIDSNYNKVNTY